MIPFSERMGSSRRPPEMTYERKRERNEQKMSAATGRVVSRKMKNVNESDRRFGHAAF
jgi:hypothetical protein